MSYVGDEVPHSLTSIFVNGGLELVGVGVGVGLAVQLLIVLTVPLAKIKNA